MGLDLYPGSFKQDARAFGTALKAMVPLDVEWANDARAEVRDTNRRFKENSNLPNPVKDALVFVGPPETKTEAWFNVGLAVVPGAGKLASKPASKAVTKGGGTFIAKLFAKRTAATVATDATVGIGLGALDRAVYGQGGGQPVPRAEERNVSAPVMPGKSPVITDKPKPTGSTWVLPVLLVGGALLFALSTPRRTT